MLLQKIWWELYPYWDSLLFNLASKTDSRMLLSASPGSSFSVLFVLFFPKPSFQMYLCMRCLNVYTFNIFKQVSGLDRSWQRPPGVAAKLIDSKAANGKFEDDLILFFMFWLLAKQVQFLDWDHWALAFVGECVIELLNVFVIDWSLLLGLYYIDYTLQNPGESCRHLFSVLGVANNGWYNRLYTLTGQVYVA